MARPEDSRVKIPALVHFTRLGYECERVIMAYLLRFLTIQRMLRNILKAHRLSVASMVPSW